MNGAIAVVSNHYGITPVWLLQQLDNLAVQLRLVECMYYTDSFVLWQSCDDLNDERSHADIMRFMDAAASWLQDNGY
jgi:hypothetical protein